MQKKLRVADDTTLIVTTYNKPVFLELVLKSVMRQRVLPCEVIVADEGRGELPNTQGEHSHPRGDGTTTENTGKKGAESVFIR